MSVGGAAVAGRHDAAGRRHRAPIGAWAPSLRNRVAATVAVLVLIALAGASAVLYSTLRTSLSGQRDRSLVEAVADTPALLRAFKQNARVPPDRATPSVPAAAAAAQARKRAHADSGATGSPTTSAGDPPIAPAALATGPVTVGSTTLQFIADPKVVGAGSGFVPVSARDLQLLGGRSGPYLADETVDGRQWRVYTARLSGYPTVLVRAAVPAGQLNSALAELLALLAGITVGGALLAGLAGRLLAGRVLRPVATLTHTVERVAATRDLTVPIPARGRDEIARLARSFATMMAGLDDSVRSQRQLVADASHELRTPLTSLTTNLDLLGEGRGPLDDQAPALIGEARHQVGELTALVNDLIELARYGRVGTHVEDVRLDLLTADVVGRAASRAPGLTLRTDLVPVLARADPDALERAVGNLVDNAIKWSPDGGQILVRVTGDGVISVADQGPGIAAADIPHVFDRFYRAPAARALPGSGLGLAIVQQVARTHGGSVAVEPLQRGVRLQMQLPTVPG